MLSVKKVSRRILASEEVEILNEYLYDKNEQFTGAIVAKNVKVYRFGRRFILIPGENVFVQLVYRDYWGLITEASGDGELIHVDDEYFIVLPAGGCMRLCVLISPGREVGVERLVEIEV